MDRVSTISYGTGEWTQAMNSRSASRLATTVSLYPTLVITSNGNFRFKPLTKLERDPKVPSWSNSPVKIAQKGNRKTSLWERLQPAVWSCYGNQWRLPEGVWMDIGWEEIFALFFLVLPISVSFPFLFFYFPSSWVKKKVLFLIVNSNWNTKLLFCYYLLGCFARWYLAMQNARKEGADASVGLTLTVAVRLFSDRSQKVVRTEKWHTQPLGECVTDVLTTFWHILWSITEQRHGKMESISFK